MGFLVSPANIWEAMRAAGMQQEARQFARDMEERLERAARDLAAKVGIESGGAQMEAHDFCGLLVSLRPAHKGQALPECLKGADDESAWEEDSDDEKDGATSAP